jgi:hypothetical protein
MSVNNGTGTFVVSQEFPYLEEDAVIQRLLLKRSVPGLEDADKVRNLEEPGEQCNVVFALNVTGPASEFVCVYVCGGGGRLPHPHLFH